MGMVLFFGMKDVLVPIDPAGRIVLPKDVRQELAIKPGDTLKIVVHGSSVTLTPNREKAGFVRKGRALIFSSTSNEILTDVHVSDILADSRNERDMLNFNLPHSKKSRS